MVLENKVNDNHHQIRENDDMDNVGADVDDGDADNDTLNGEWQKE